MPEIFMGPDMVQIAQPGFDASNPNLAPDEVKFSTSFRGLAILNEIMFFTGPTTSIERFNYNETYRDRPLIIPAARIPANEFGQNSGDGNDCIVMNPGFTITLTQDGVTNTYTFYVFYTSDSFVRVDPLYNREVAENPSSFQVWVYVFRRGAAAAGTGAGGMHIAGGSDPELRISRPGDNPVTADEDDLFYSSKWQTAPVIASGSVNLSSGGAPDTMDVSIPNLGYKPAIFFMTDKSTGGGCVRHVNNSTLRFYKNLVTDEDNFNYIHWEAYAIPMPGV